MQSHPVCKLGVDQDSSNIGSQGENLRIFSKSFLRSSVLLDSASKRFNSRIFRCLRCLRFRSRWRDVKGIRLPFSATDLFKLYRIADQFSSFR